MNWYPNPKTPNLHKWAKKIKILKNKPGEKYSVNKILFVLLVWHLGVKIAMKYATAGFVIYGAPGFILGHENRNLERGYKEIHKYIQGRQLFWISREIILHAIVN